MGRVPSRPVLPADDLYARLEVPPTASPEVIELAWRALLRQHHPDVAGPEGLDTAKRINVAHDWLSDPSLRALYDRERGLAGGGRGHRSPRDATYQPRGGPGPDPRRPVRRPTEPAHAIARFLDRILVLTSDELDRLALADPTPIAFVATIRRFIAPDHLAVLDSTGREAVRRLGGHAERTGVRDAILAYAAELILGPDLDELLSEPFRSRTRERLMRGWEAAVGQPRYGPNGAAIVALLERLGGLSDGEARALAKSGTLDRLGDEPWPPDMSPEDEDGLRVSAELGAMDAATAVTAPTLDPAALVRARRAAARCAHLLVLRHLFADREFDRMTAPWRPWLIMPRTRPSTRVRPTH
jgi:curved DNA-binding protein CbpA